MKAVTNVQIQRRVYERGDTGCVIGYMDESRGKINAKKIGNWMNAEWTNGYGLEDQIEGNWMHSWMDT